MSRQLYLECNSGISGDMTVAALLDLGASQEVLRQALSTLSVSDEFDIEITRVKKSGLDACDFDVKLRDIDNKDHDMEYLHGEHQEHAGKTEEPKHHHHGHSHRSYEQVMAIVDSAKLTPKANKLAHKVFDILAQAEAQAHGVEKSQVHFHEVGAVDSIVDIVSFAVCMDNLGITSVCIPRITEGSGNVRCQHGVIPVPVPAVVNIMQQSGLVLTSCNIQGELVTPTGAALAAAIMTTKQLPDTYQIVKVGMGAGKREYERPSILRAFLIEVDDNDKQVELDSGETKDTIYKLESNIDDCTGEILGYVMELLLEAGARDVHYMPVFMKKNRPAYQLNVICTQKDIPVMEEIIFRETTTIGIRRVEMERTILQRETLKVETPVGDILVKVCWHHGTIYCYPEYDSIHKILAENKDLEPRYSFQQIYIAAQRKAYKIIQKKQM